MSVACYIPCYVPGYVQTHLPMMVLHKVREFGGRLQPGTSACDFKARLFGLSSGFSLFQWHSHHAWKALRYLVASKAALDILQQSCSRQSAFSSCAMPANVHNKHDVASPRSRCRRLLSML